jgi:prophage antirepressor-like protein
VDELMLSESGVYAMLIHHYHPENRSLRHWITNEVVPALRDAQHVPVESVPNLSLLQWSGFSLSMLQWQNEPWIRLRDVPQVLPQPQVGVDGVSGKAQSPWWAAASRMFQGA